jgi:hypothetical protein
MNVVIFGATGMVGIASAAAAATPSAFSRASKPLYH